MYTPDTVRVPYRKLLAFTRATFAEHGMPPDRAHTAAAALCYADLRGLAPHGLAELAHRYLPALADGRADPGAEPEVLHETGACAHLDAHRALGLWAASDATDRAIDRALQHGLGLVSVRNSTPFGCAGVHALRATRDGMIGLVASTGAHHLSGAGANPLGVAAPALDQRPFVLDLSAARQPQDPGFPLVDHTGRHEVRWPGADPAADAAEGLGLVVPLLTAMLSGAATADIGSSSGGATDFVVLALAPGVICPGQDPAATARSLFSTLSPVPVVPQQPRTERGTAHYPGWVEAERAAHALHEGVPLSRDLHEELVSFGLDDAEQSLSPASR